MGRPVSMAAARGGALRDELLRTAETLSSQLDRVVGELRTLSDPDAAAAQIETVTTETARQVAEAEARASRATAAERTARAASAEANAAASDLDGQLAAAREEIEPQAGLLAAATTRVDELGEQLATTETARATATTQVAELTGQLTAVTGERDTATAEVARLRDELAAASTRADLSVA